MDIRKEGRGFHFWPRSAHDGGCLGTGIIIASFIVMIVIWISDCTDDGPSEGERVAAIVASTIQTKSAQPSDPRDRSVANYRQAKTREAGAVVVNIGQTKSAQTRRAPPATAAATAPSATAMVPTPTEAPARLWELKDDAPLHRAAFDGNAQAVADLLDQGTDTTLRLPHVILRLIIP